MVEAVVRSGGLAFAVILAVATLHKLRVLFARAATREPLVVVGTWSRAHPNLALLWAASVEACIVAALVAWPAIGYIAFSALMLAYLWRLRLLGAAEDCNCFGEFFAARSRAAAMRRNAFLAVISLGLGLLVATGAVEPADLSGLLVGIVLVPTAARLALHLLDTRFSTPHART